MTPKERIYATIAGKDVDRPAVTPIFMAWAAHYVGHTYRDYYLDSAVLAKAQLAVTRDFNIDQISAISDPFRETSAYGVEFDWPEEGVGKAKELLINSPADISRVAPIDIENSARTRDRLEGVKKLAAEVAQTHSVLGWVEGPVAEYGDLRGVENTLMDLIDRPDMFAEACRIIVENAINFARAQIAAGADMIGVAIDAATPELFDRYRGQGIGGPHRWEHYWAAVEKSVQVMGAYQVGVHLIVGLGETEQEMIAAIQRAQDMGAHTHLFSFFPEAGSPMENHPQPPYGQYRRVQLARYIINNEYGRYEQMTFNAAGQVVDFGLDTEEFIHYGEPFMTSGCPGPNGRVACNRPFGNERPGQPVRNYAFPPEPEDVALIRYQLQEYTQPEVQP